VEAAARGLAQVDRELDRRRGGDGSEQQERGGCQQMDLQVGDDEREQVNLGAGTGPRQRLLQQVSRRACHPIVRVDPMG
jgi:hypothetical protein